MADQNQSYGSKSAVPSKTKVIATKALAAPKAGGMSGSGPTGSSTSYPKGSSVNMSPARFSPMNGMNKGWVVGGV